MESRAYVRVRYLMYGFEGSTTLPRPRITRAFQFTEALHDPLQLECIELAPRWKACCRFVGLAMIAE